MSYPFPETRRCSGPAHAEPVLLPLTEEHWYFHRSGPSKGKPVTPCRQCANWRKLLKPNGPHGYLPLDDVLPFLRELIERCGSLYQAKTRYHFAEDTLRQALLGNRSSMQKKTVARILVALKTQRELDRRNGGSRSHRDAVRKRAGVEHMINRKMKAV